jgi:hypothetical protein
LEEGLEPEVIDAARESGGVLLTSVLKGLIVLAGVLPEEVVGSVHVRRLAHVIQPVCSGREAVEALGMLCVACQVFKVLIRQQPRWPRRQERAFESTSRLHLFVQCTSPSHDCSGGYRNEPPGLGPSSFLVPVVLLL